MYYMERGGEGEVLKNMGEGIWWGMMRFGRVG